MEGARLMYTNYFPCESVVEFEGSSVRRGELQDELNFAFQIENIYNHLADQKSMKIFSSRLMYSLTKDYRFMAEMIKDTQIGKEFINELSRRQKFPIYIYGAGIKGRRLVHFFPEIRWSGYIDKNKTGECNGLPIIGINEIHKFDSDFTILISVNMNPSEIKSDLMKMGVSEDKILVLREFDKKAGKSIYFDSDILREESKRYTFVDVGCFDGKDTKKFIEWSGNESAKVEAFEADAINYNQCVSELKRFANVHVHNCGLSEKNEIRKFKMSMTPSSRFAEDGDVEIVVKPLDDVISHLCVGGIGYIKMDIEGAEAEAIKGAQRIIKEQRPDLAISIYHKREDIWNLPTLLLDINPNYKFYLRHYTLGITDTVLYAVDSND